MSRWLCEATAAHRTGSPHRRVSADRRESSMLVAIIGLIGAIGAGVVGAAGAIGAGAIGVVGTIAAALIGAFLH